LAHPVYDFCEKLCTHLAVEGAAVLPRVGGSHFGTPCTIITERCMMTYEVKYQRKSLQYEQKVGCLKNVAMNLWPITSWTLGCLMAPRLFAMPRLNAAVSAFNAHDNCIAHHAADTTAAAKWH